MWKWRHIFLPVFTLQSPAGPSGNYSDILLELFCLTTPDRQGCG